MNVLIYPFLALSAVGFAALLAIHVASLFGVAYPFEHFIGILGSGIFVVFLPTIFVMNRLTRDFRRIFGVLRCAAVQRGCVAQCGRFSVIRGLDFSSCPSSLVGGWILRQTKLASDRAH